MSKTDVKYVPGLKSKLAAGKQDLQKELKLENVNQVPKLVKVVVSCGLGKARDDKKILEVATNTLRKITGQEPIKILAKKSIATFKIRKGLNTIGAKVTLRGDTMYEFVERLTDIVLPRVRDFHGTSNKFDKGFNYNIGLVSQDIFPELSFEETTTPHGMQVTFVIDGATSNEQAKALMFQCGIPFEKVGTAKGKGK
jgi:large subunit ribosomal protein L5